MYKQEHKHITKEDLGMNIWFGMNKKALSSLIFTFTQDGNEEHTHNQHSTASHSTRMFLECGIKLETQGETHLDMVRKRFSHRANQGPWSYEVAWFSM